jgi:hypothetical protein
MRIATLGSLAVMFSALLGCDAGGPGAVGAPCNTADDCEGNLICDEHNGQGSCQEPHGHSEGGDETGEPTTSDPATSTTADPDPSDTEGSSTTGEGTSGSTTDAESSSSTSGGSEICEAFCGCMQTACSSFDAYPYADEAACMTACEAFDEAQLTCFGGFCQQAMDSEGTLVEHYCEHAWGALGNEKC